MAWLLGSFCVLLTAAQLAEASGIRNILSLGPGKIFLCFFCVCGKNFKDSLCVAYCMLNIFKNIRTKVFADLRVLPPGGLHPQPSRNLKHFLLMLH